MTTEYICGDDYGADAYEATSPTAAARMRVAALIRDSIEREARNLSSHRLGETHTVRVRELDDDGRTVSQCEITVPVPRR